MRFVPDQGVLPSRWIAIHVAGWEAEALAGFRVWHPLLPNRDWLMARRIALAAGLGPFEAEAVLADQRDGVRSWLAIPVVWREVARLAERLRDEGVIAGATWEREQDRLAALLPPLPGPPTPCRTARRRRLRQPKSWQDRLCAEAVEILGPSLPLWLVFGAVWLARLCGMA